MSVSSIELLNACQFTITQDQIYQLLLFLFMLNLLVSNRFKHVLSIVFQLFMALVIMCC